VTLDLERYFARIGWRGERSPTLATLAGLVRRHVEAVPFENLDVLLHRPIGLSLGALVAKLVDARRGGYCYEHATLFAHVLRALGFAVATHSARVIMLRPKAEAPRTHMFLTVALPEGTFVVDPGFGGLAPRAPVPLDGSHVEVAGDEHWLERDGTDRMLTARTPDKIVAAWTTTLEEEFPIDFELANHYTSTHPESAFTQRLLARSYTPEGKLTIANRDVTLAGRTWQLANRGELRGLLAKSYGFDLPEVTDLAIPSLPEWQ
jgi:N-hydroxyarylamine O-acetyltransferase